MVVNPRNPVQASTKLAANLVEAVIGAVWLDSDESMSAVRQVMETLGLGLNGMVKLNPFSLL
jgi:ribonuclease-3